MNAAGLLMPSQYGQGKVYLYITSWARTPKYISLFKNKSKFMSVEINIWDIKMFMKVGGRDPWCRICGRLNDINTARLSLLYVHNRH